VTAYVPIAVHGCIDPLLALIQIVCVAMYGAKKTTRSVKLAVVPAAVAPVKLDAQG